MKRLLITLLLGMAVLCQAAAQNTSLKRHQVRIGWGDMLFETLAFHNSPSRLDGTVKTRDYRYYWDYDRESRVYDNYNWPYGYFYSLVDMYDQYGFVDKVYSQGPEDYDFSGDWLKDGEITSRVSALTLLYKDGKMEIIGQTHFPREVI